MKRVIVFGMGSGPMKVLSWLSSHATIVAVVMPWCKSDEDLEPALTWAKEHRILILRQGNEKEDGLRDAITILEADIGVICSYPLRIPENIISIPPLGIINIHGGKLPQYRGPHVLQWAIINGDKEVGITLHYIDKDFDSGDVVATTKLYIRQNEDAAKIYKRMIAADARLLSRCWQGLTDGTAKRLPQDARKATYWRRRYPQDGLINWADSAKDIHNLIRALVKPWPGAFSYIDGNKVVINKSVVIAKEDVEKSKKKGIIITTGDGLLLVTQATIRQQRYNGRQLRRLLVGKIFQGEDK